MRFCTIVEGQHESVAVMAPGGGILPLASLGQLSGRSLPATMEELIAAGVGVVAEATLDEIPDIHQLKVRTVLNGEVKAENIVANMTFNPYHLVAFHSEVMTLQPGDVISTGTPGAVVIEDGDVAEAQVDLLGTLVNPVVRFTK